MSKYTDEDLLNILKNYYKEYGKSPKICNIQQSTIIKRRFGSWNNGLILAELPLNMKTPEPPRNVICKQCGTLFKKQVCEINKTPNNFCSRSCSATYGNTHKKHGTRRSKVEEWLTNRIEEYGYEVNANKIDEIGYELDIYIPSMNLAFEVNGIVHYKPIYGEKKFKRTQEIDKIKKKRCKENDIELHVIDVSKQDKFKPKTSMKYLEYILLVIEEKVFMTSFNI